MFRSGTLVFSAIRQLRLVSIRPRIDGSWAMYWFMVFAKGAGFSVWMALVLLNIIRMDFLWTGGRGMREYFWFGCSVAVGVVVGWFWVCAGGGDWWGSSVGSLTVESSADI